MELMIRSQDKMKLYKCEKIDIKTNLREDYMRFVTIDTIYINDTEFGTYDERNRALEIVDEIQEILEQVNDPNLTILPILVYKMPQR